MAKVFLNSGESFTLANSAEVYGAAGTGTEKVLLTGAATAITTDQNIERVDLSGNLNAYTFQVVGNQVKVYAGTTLVTTIGVKGDTTGTKVAFGDGSTDLKITGLNQATLGGQALSSTAAAAVTGATLDATDKSATAGSTGTTTPGVGQAFTLTNTTTGKIASLTTGNDTVNASTNVDTLNGASVTDGSTTDNDTLNAVITANATPTSVTNIETLGVDFKGFGVTLDATNISYGLTSGAGTTIKATTSQLNNDAATISGLSSRNVNVEIDSTIKNLTLTGTASSVDAAKLTLSGGSLGLTNTSGTGVETLTLNSKGAANIITLTAGNGTGNSYIASGDQNLTIKGTTTLFGSGTGSSTKFSKDASFTKTLTLENTSTGAVAFNNAVADKIVLSAAVGGSGATFANNANVSLNVANALSGSTGDLARPSGDSTSTLSTLNLSVDKVDALSAGTVTFGEGVKTLNLVANADIVGSILGGNVTLQFDDATTGDDTVTLNLSGSKDVYLSATSVIGSTSGGTDKLVINAGALSGKLTVVTTALTNAIEKSLVIGSEQNDSITGGASGDTLIGGGGNDTITGGVGADSINGGSGNDTITLSSGADTVYGGAGSDTFILGSGAASGAIVKDFVVGTDVLVLTGTGTLLDATKVVLSNGALSGISNFNNVTFENNDTQLVNSSISGDNWSTSLQLGSSSTAYAIAIGTSGITAGSLNDNISVSATGDAGGNRLINLGAGDDKITLAGVGQNNSGAITIVGGAGNDTIILSTASGTGGTDVVKFEATAAVNGVDTISGYDASGTGTDKLDFSAFLGATGINMVVSGGSGTGASGAIDLSASSGVGVATGNDIYLAFNGKTTLSASDFTSTTGGTSGKLVVENNSKAVVILAQGATTATQASIYYVEDTDASAAVNYAITLVGTLNINDGTVATMLGGTASVV